MSQQVNPSGVDTSYINQEINQLQKAQLLQLQVPNQPSLFRRVLGGMTGIAGNVFAPGWGSFR